MSTNLHIDDIGNLILRDGKLNLFVSSQYVIPPHYGGGRVGALSPYVYCGGDPINRIDPTGMEWGTRQNEDGTTTIYVDVQLIVDGDGITDEMIEAYKQAICSEFNRMISEASGGTYLGEVTFNGNVVEGQVTPTLIVSQYGDAAYGGITNGANSVVGIFNESYQYLNPIDFASTAIHELLHTARLAHPFEKTQTLDSQLFKIGKDDYVSSPLTDPNILYNVMNYPFTSIDGKTYDSMDF